MSAALGVVGVSLVIVLMITAVATLAWRKRVLRRRDETPEERYSHAVSHLRSRSRTRRVRNDGSVGSIWAAIFVPINYLHLGGDGDSGDSGDDGGGCGGGGD